MLIDYLSLRTAKDGSQKGTSAAPGQFIAKT